MRRALVMLVGLLVVGAALLTGVAAGGSGRSDARWVMRDLRVEPQEMMSPAGGLFISDDGAIAGSVLRGGLFRGFIWSKGNVTDLGVLPGHQQSIALAANGRGQIVGSSYAGRDNYGEFSSLCCRRFSRAFVWANGAMTALEALPGGRKSGASAINDRGEIVGWSGDGAAPRAALWRQRRVINLGVLPGFASSEAIGINERGEILVNSWTPGGSGNIELSRGTDGLWRNGKLLRLGGHASAINDRGQIIGWTSTRGTPFVWEKGRKRDLGTLGGSSSAAVAINDRGQIVGSADTGAKDSTGEPISHAFVWENGKMRDLGTLGGSSSAAVAINGRGQIVGSAETGAKDSTGSPIFHAFVWENGEMRDLGTLGGQESGAYGINNRGQIVGWATTRAGQRHAAVWTKNG